MNDFRKHVRLLLLLLTAMFCTPKAWSQDNGYGPQEFTCPVGGETFRQDVTMVYYPLEGVPNGSSLGGQFSDRMVPICPGNGLVLAPKYDGEEGDAEEFTAYTPDEIAQLPALISSAEYKALANETAYFRLYWLAGKLNRPALQRFHLLQHVSWVGATPEQHRANLDRFVVMGEALIDAPGFDPARRWRARYFIANALRELGHFDEAQRRLEALQAEWTVERTKILAALPVNPHFEEDGDVSRDYFSDEIGSLLTAIAERDDDYSPVSMMGDKGAGSACSKLDDAFPPATEATKRGCAKRAALAAQWEKDWEAEQKLLDEPAKLVALCKAKPKVQRDNILASACDRVDRQAEREAMQAEATRLLKNLKALDIQCKDVNIPYRYSTAKTALGEACQERRDHLLETNAAVLATKFRNQPGEYERMCTWEYPQMSSIDPVEVACEEVQGERDRASDDKERARLDKMTEAEIWVECEKEKATYDATLTDVPGVRPYTPLSWRCSDMENKRDEARWKALEADPVKLAAACALPDSEQEEWYDMRCYYRQESLDDDAALALAVDHDALVASCAATPAPQRDRILRKACSGYLKCVIAPRGIDVGANPSAIAPYFEEETSEEGEQQEGPPAVLAAPVPSMAVPFVQKNTASKDQPGPYCFETLEDANRFNADHNAFARTPEQMEAERRQQERTMERIKKMGRE